MPTTFFGWVGKLVQDNAALFLRGTGTTLLIALSGTILGFVLGLLVAIARSKSDVVEHFERPPRVSACLCGR